MMAQRLRVEHLVSNLVTGFGLQTSTSRNQNHVLDKDRILQALADPKSGRTNQFEVAARFDGLDEKCGVFNNDQLADALKVRLDELSTRSNRWTPEVLSLLLKLSDRPIENTNVEGLADLKPAVPPKPLTWSDVIADDPLDNHDGLWDDVDFARDGSDEDADSLIRLPSLSESSSEATLDCDDLSVHIRDLALEPDEEGLQQVIGAQYWNQAIIGADVQEEPERNKRESSIALTEAQIIREVLFMLLGLPSSIYEERVDGPSVQSSRYGLRCLDQEAASPILDRFALLGHELAAVRQWRQRLEQDAILQTFQACVTDSLATIEIALAQIQAQYVRPKGIQTTLLSLQAEIEVLTQPLRLLVPMLSKVDENGKAGKPYLILELLYDSVCTNDSSGNIIAFEYLADMFLTCLRTYLKPVRQWMDEGELSQFNQNGFIRESEKVVPPSCMWADRFYSSYDESGHLCVPKFLHVSTQKILTAGKSVNFLKLLGHPWPIDGVMRQKPESVTLESVKAPSGSSAFESFMDRFDAAMDAWIHGSHHASSAVLMHHLETQCGLHRILDAMQYIYLFQNGHLSSLLAKNIFDRIDHKRGQWNDAFVLTDLFRNMYAGIQCIDVESLALRSVFKSSSRTHRAQGSTGLLGSLHLIYTIPWPIANIITKESVSIYKRVWLLLLQVQRAKQMLEGRFSRSIALELMDDGSGYLAVMLRHRMLCWVNQFFSYLTDVVISSAAAEMRQRMASAEDTDGLITVHQDYIKRLQEQCLLSEAQKSTLQAITSVLDLIVLFTVTCIPSDIHGLAPSSEQSKTPSNARLIKTWRRQEADSSSSDEEENAAEKDSSPELVDLWGRLSIMQLRKMRDTFTQLHTFILAGLRNFSKGEEDNAIELLVGGPAQPPGPSSFQSHLETLRNSQPQRDFRDDPGCLEARRLDTLGRSQPSTEIVVQTSSTTANLEYFGAFAAEAQGYRSFATAELTPSHHGAEHLVIFVQSHDGGHGLAVLRTAAQSISIHPKSIHFSSSVPQILYFKHIAKKQTSTQTSIKVTYITITMAICNEANEHSQHVEPEIVEDSETEQEAPSRHDNPEVQSAPKPGPRMNDDQKRALQIHNQARRDASNISKHPRPALVWDNKLHNDAQAYAQHLANQNRGLQHSSGDSRKGEGENLAWSKPNGSFHDASQMWVNEKKDYHGQKVGEGNFGAYG
ncbi:MAG: hypothetical protein Q9174_003782 [Haloplaca sp. 1 TL-2023]